MVQAVHKPGTRLGLKPLSQIFSGIALSLMILCGVPSTATAAPAGTVLSCQTLDKIQRLFLSQHIQYREPNAELESRTIKQYIKQLDPAKLYLYESDVADITKEMKGIFDRLKAKNPDCSSLDKVQALYIKRVRERADFAKKTILAKSFKFNNKVELVLDPQARSYPKKKADADSFQLKYLQFQLSNYLATGMKLEEAKEQVVRSYERAVKRISETTKEDIFSAYLDSFGRALDPHSSYFSREALEDFDIQMSLSLEGIGATLSSQDGFTTIEALIDGGSAKRSGLLQPQDKITAVGQFDAKGNPLPLENVVEMELREVVRKIRGPKGTKVRLQILRKKADGSAERFLVDLVRDKIKLEDEAASLSFLEREVNGEKKKIAVINLPSFYADSKRGGRSSAADVKNLIKKARAEKADALVLDLSQNGGGSLDDAVKIAGLFIRSGNIVKQSGRNGVEREIALEDRDTTVDWAGPTVVLTSRISASASEIVAGTLKDYQRAVIVGGDHTFGKGSVQSVMPLPLGLGAVKVTVGMFFTPGGYSTQHKGVEADIPLPGRYSTDEVGEKSLDYSLPPAHIKPFLSPEAYVSSGPGAWKKVEPAVITLLKNRSAARVAKNEEFQKIVEEQKKAKEKGKVVKLADSIKETEKKKGENEKKKDLTKAEKMAEYLKRPEIQEAANVAADLLALQRGIVLTDATDAKPNSDDLASKKTR